MSQRAVASSPGDQGHRATGEGPPLDTDGAAFRGQMRKAYKVLAVTSLGLMFVIVNGTSVNLALPAMSEYFAVDATTANWFLVAFMLANTASILVFGRISDLAGRKRIYLWGLVAYVVLSIACVFAPNAVVMIVLRVLQGIAMATTVSNTTALIADAFPAGRLAQGLSLNITAAAVAQTVGPTIGGILVSLWGWQSIFIVGVPFGVASILLGLKVLPSGRRQPAAKRERFDIAGALLSMAGLSLLLYGMNQISVEGLGSPVVLGTLAGGVVLLVAFVMVEFRIEHPLVDVTLVRDFARAFAYSAAFFNSFARSGVIVLVALHQQIVYGRNPFEAGLVLMVMALAMMITSPLAGRLSAVLTARTLSAIGGVLIVVGVTALIFTTGAHSLPAVMVWLGLLGAGVGLFTSPNTTAIMAGVPATRRATANSVRSMLFNSAQAIGTTAALLCLTLSGVTSYAGRTDDVAVQTGFQIGYGVLAIAAVITLVLSVARGGAWIVRRTP